MLLLYLSIFAIVLNGLGRPRDLFSASLMHRVNGTVILFCVPQARLRLVMRAGVLQPSDHSSDLRIKVPLKRALLVNR